MYEDITYEVLLKRMLDRALANDKNLDSREGSLLWYGQAPAAVELQNLYIALDNILQQAFADTATLPYLIRKANERGLTYNEATYAIRQGEFSKLVKAYEKVETYVGELDYCTDEYVLMSINGLNADDKVVLHFIGTSVGAFRYWLSNGAWKAASAITSVNDRYFDITVEITTLAEASNVQFKGPQGGTLDGLSISYCGIFYGSMDEYNAALEAMGVAADGAVLSGFDVPIGSRFSLNQLNYFAVEKIRDGIYKMQCETAGSVGNLESGSLIPIDYIEGLEIATLTDVLVFGEDAEDVEHLRQRYFDSISSQAYGGNIADYKAKVLAIAGVGGVKVTPVWNGGGTVKLTIIDSAFNVPSSYLVDMVQELIDPVAHSGEGYGLAPIGHVVTVEGVEGVAIDIATEITYRSGWSWEACASLIRDAVDDYFEELAKSWDSNDQVIIRISQLESRILDCEGVLDISGTTLNDSSVNLYLATNEVPVRGAINGN